MMRLDDIILTKRNISQSLQQILTGNHKLITSNTLVSLFDFAVNKSTDKMTIQWKTTFLVDWIKSLVTKITSFPILVTLQKVSQLQETKWSGNQHYPEMFAMIKACHLTRKLGWQKETKNKLEILCEFQNSSSKSVYNKSLHRAFNLLLVRTKDS